MTLINLFVSIQVYAVETQADIGICVKRNTHQRKLSDIQKVSACTTQPLVSHLSWYGANTL